MTAAPRPSVAHGTFTVERHYDASPARVFRAHSDSAAFRRWFADGDGWTIFEWEHDFRVGGGFTGRFRFGDESNDTWFNDTEYLDILPDQRIILSYVMGRVAGDEKRRASASLGTTELVADGSGTRLIYTEQGAFLDGNDDIAGREVGCAEMLEALARELEANP
jgi:uncharacterized protein YndB with AHSA1/START domain